MMNQTASPAQIAKLEASEFQTLLDKPHRASIETYVNQSPDPTKAIERFGEWIGKSGMFGCTRTEQGMIIAITCIEMRIGLVEFAQTFDIMHNGKLRKKALAAQVEFEQLGGKVRWIDAGEGREKAEAEFSYNGQTKTFRFTIEDARRANLVKKDGAWETWTADMLCVRVLSLGIKRLCPKIYAGFESDDSEQPSLVLPKMESTLPKPEAAAPAPTPAAPAPASPATATQAVASATAAASTSALLSVAEAEDLMTFIGADNIDKAEAWMLRQLPPWLTPEQVASGNSFCYLTPKRVARIRGNKEGFLRAVNNPAQTA